MGAAIASVFVIFVVLAQIDDFDTASEVSVGAAALTGVAGVGFAYLTAARAGANRTASALCAASGFLVFWGGVVAALFWA